MSRNACKVLLKVRADANQIVIQTPWRNGSASDSRSEGSEFESLWPQLCCVCVATCRHDDACVAHSSYGMRTTDTAGSRHLELWPASCANPLFLTSLAQVADPKKCNPPPAQAGSHQWSRRGVVASAEATATTSCWASSEGVLMRTTIVE